MAKILKIRCVVTCGACKRPRVGSLHLNKTLRLEDTSGFVISNLDGLRIVCDACCHKERADADEDLDPGETISNGKKRDGRPRKASRT